MTLEEIIVEVTLREVSIVGIRNLRRDEILVLEILRLRKDLAICAEALRDYSNDIGDETSDSLEKGFLMLNAETSTSLLKVLLNLLDAYDFENQCIYLPMNASCPVCTSGVVPGKYNKGLCLLHKARAVIVKAQEERTPKP